MPKNNSKRSKRSKDAAHALCVTDQKSGKMFPI